MPNPNVDNLLAKFDKNQEPTIYEDLELYQIADSAYWIDPSEGHVFKCANGTFTQKSETLYNGYLRTRISYDGWLAMVSVHKLIACLLDDKPTEQHTIDHIDREKTNNSLSNLRWADKIEQATNRDDVKPFEAIDQQGNKHRFQSTHDAERQMGFKNQNISKCLRGQRKTHHGYRFIYIQPKIIIHLKK